MKSMAKIALALMFILNIILLTAGRNEAVASLRTIKGITGSKDGIPVCHCPDDKADCNCDIMAQ